MAYTTFRKAAVLGSGVMGAAIAAHFANAGLEVDLLDIVPPQLTENDVRKGWNAETPSFRNRLADTAKERLLKQKPSPIYTKQVLERIHTGNLEDDLYRIGDADWVIEVIVENLQAKQALLEKVEQYWKPGTIVSSNTSGISIRQMASGRSAEFKKHFMGTHFFNPPRYMKLLEIIPTEQTDGDIAATVRTFCERVLGKGVVVAKDTPNFIANRIGTYGMMVTLEQMQKYGLTVSDVDALTGPMIGRPKSATFRTLDLVGLDTFVHVAANVYENIDDPAEKQAFAVPELLQRLVAKGSIGEKAGIGFYQAKQTESGKEIYQYDAAADRYVPKNKSRFASVETAKNSKSIEQKLKAMTSGSDAGSQFVWSVLKKVLLYSAAKVPEIADEIAAVDDAMKWGFNWQLGPFETWDAIGLKASVARMEAEGETVPEWVKSMLASGKTSFYENQNGTVNYVRHTGETVSKRDSEHIIRLSDLKERNGVIIKNSGASLIDLGDGVACLEFHSPNNTAGPDVLQMISRSLDEVNKNYRGLVVGHQGKNFCVGANLMMLLMEAQDENWFVIDQMIQQFQQASMAMKYFEKPIVSAPFAMTLGGGVELSIPAAQVQASAETYMGLVEVGVGLIPSGAGTKEMLVRFTQSVDFDGKVDLQPFVNRAFELIGLAKVSTSAQEAKQLGYLRANDKISMNQDHLIYDAKQAVLALSSMGFQPPEPAKIRVVGEPGLAVLKLGLYQMKCGGQISAHDELIGRKLAHILSGGIVAANSLVSEQYLLDLEREAFLSLCGEPKSQARMQHMLQKGKPLRN